MRPRFKQQLEATKASMEGEEKDIALAAYFTWLDGFYQGFGTGAEQVKDDGNLAVRLPMCHWIEEARGNPIF